MSDPPPPPPPPAPHVSAPSTNPPYSPLHASPSIDPPPPPLVLPSTDPTPSPPHVSSFIDPPPPHALEDFDALDTMFTSGAATQVDLDGNTFDSDVLLAFIFGIGTGIPFTSSSRDIDASGYGGGPSE
jgi:hypothetical protein